MNDLISRRAAIDALMEILDRPNHAEFLYTDEICRTLERLPSAQPEVIRCGECVHWKQDTVRQNSNDVSWWNEAVCEKHSDDIWTAWRDADWYCADAERRTDEGFDKPSGGD